MKVGASMRGVVGRRLITYVLLMGVFVISALHSPTPVAAATGINEQINFQGRLFNSQGATVPDGFYNIQFKLYQDGAGTAVGNPGGTLLWTESHLNNASQGVQVKNGFMSVQLGSVTAFGSSVDWNQDTIWLSMNIGNTNPTCTPFGSCGPDGEMVPMKRLSATPYALNAKSLGGLTAAQFVQFAPGGAQTDASTNSSININKTSTGNFVTLQASGTTAFSLSNAGDVVFGNNANHSLTVTQAGAGVAGKTLTIIAGDAGTGGSVNGGNLTLQGGAASGSGTAGNVIVKANGTDQSGVFQVQKAGSATAVLSVDTNTNSVQVAGLLDTTTATALNIGTTNATSIVLQKNTSISGTNTFTVGTGLSSLGGGLDVTAGPFDVTNSAALRKGADFSATGTTHDANFGEASYIRLTGASAQTITGIANGRDGEILTISNAASQVATLANNNNGSAAINRIITGSGVDVSLPAGASLTLVYDSTSTLWRATGGVAGVTTVGAIDSQTKSANGAVIAGTSIYLQNADASNVGLVSTGSQTLAGAKTFSSLLTGSAGATISGATTSVNASSNFATNINTGTSTGAVSIGNSLAGAISLQSASTIGLTGTTSVTGLSSGVALTVSNSTSTGNIVNFNDNATTVASIADGGAVLLRNTTDSATAFRVQNALGTSTIFDVDTGNGYVGVGTAAPARPLHVVVNNSTVNGQVLKLEQAGTGDVGLEFTENGQSFYAGVDATDHKFKISSSAVGSTTQNMGYTTIGGTADSANRNFMNATKFTAGATGTVNTIYAYIESQISASPNDKGQAAIYSDSSGSPGTRLGYSLGDTTLTGAAWNAFPITSASVTSGTDYWLVYNTNATSDDDNNLQIDAGGTDQFKWNDQTYGTWPTSYGTPDGDSDFRASIYTVITTGTSSDNFLTSLFQMNATGETLFQNSANSVNAFRLQNVAGTDLFRLDTSNTTLNLGVTGTTATASTVNIGTSTGAAQLVRLGATGSGTAASGTLVNIQGGTTANTAVTIGTNTTGGITIDTGTTGSILIGGGTAGNPAKTISIGPTATNSGTTTYNLGVNTAGTQAIRIGSATTNTAANGTTVLMQGGNTSSALSLQALAGGTINIGTNNAANTIQIGSTTLNSSTQAINIGNNNTSGGTTNVVIGAGGSATGGTTTLQAKGNITLNTNGTTRATFDTSNGLYLGNGVTAAAPNNFTISGTGSTTTAVAGGSLVIQGGNATVGNANGGNITLTGGAGFGTGVRGLVVVDTPTMTTASTQNCSSSCNITQANIDSAAAVLINATNPSLTVTLTDPTITTAGRLMYVTNIGVNDFTLSVNGGGTGNTIAMKPNTTATMIWNGADWTAAGASSSTDLQSAYNNTLTSAGGAELVLNAPGGSADGLTIRNNATTPIVGGILEVQTSIGSNLFSVNNNATEYANNGGAESSTFTMWTGAPAGGTITRYTTAGDNIATGAASVFVDTTSTANTGVRNTLSSTLTANLKYRVSYAIRHTSSTSSFTTLDTIFSRDGTNTSTTSCATGSTATFGQWTRISCTFTAPSSGITSSNAIFIRHSDAAEHDFYVDNLSVNVSADVNHAADGSVDSALGSNWTAFDADGGAGTTTLSLENSIIYDTSGSVQDDTTNNANLGMRNNMSITPQVSTQYLVSFYARSSNTFNNITVGFLPAGGNSTPSAAQLCTDYNTQSVSTSSFTKITCLFTTPSSGITDPDLVIYQPTAPGSTRTFYVDALSITLNTNNASNVQIGGGNKGGPATLFTLDRSSSAPIADNNDAYLGSMYYDTSTGRIQCYEADGWGACGAAPDNIVNLNPEYAGAVLNGTGVGTMTADFCSNDGDLTVNSTLCSSGQAKNFYRWTSPQATQQTYSIYVTYQLPATFNGFSSDDTVQLVARVDNTTNASVTYEMYKSTGSDVAICGSGETNVITGGGGSANTWYSYGINGNEATGCSFSSSSAGNLVIFKINMKANSNANAYVSTLSFTTTGR